MIMKIKFLLALGLLIAALSNCGVNRPAESPNEKNTAISTGYTEEDARNFSGSASVIEYADASLNLTDHLRRVNGVYITGEGANARIKIQAGANSINSGTEPLFVVNGSPFSSYREVYELVSNSQIKRISVLKDASSTAMYGSRGANGVILIETQ